jgi:two-component SAPR family response regulator
MIGPLSGQTAIIVENEILIALDIQSILARLLPEKILLARNLAEARELIEAAGAIDLAILDIMLPDGICFPLARDLLKMDVPMIFLTAASEIVPEEFSRWPVIDKPFLAQDLLSAVGKIARVKDSGA